MAISKKEVIEAQYWLKLLVKTNGNFENELTILRSEARQIGMILSTIISNVRSKV